MNEHFENLAREVFSSDPFPNGPSYRIRAKKAGQKNDRNENNPLQ